MELSIFATTTIVTPHANRGVYTDVNSDGIDSSGTESPKSFDTHDYFAKADALWGHPDLAPPGPVPGPEPSGDGPWVTVQPRRRHTRVGSGRGN